MPVFPPTNAGPLDNLTTILNACRVKLGQKRVNSLAATGGQLLDWTQAGSQQLTNNAWRKLQQFAGNMGYTQVKQEATPFLGPIPITGSGDPAIVSWINWTGCSDGVNLFDSPFLPSDLLCPLKLWERPTNMNSLWGPMELMFDGLSQWQKQIFNRQWEWRSGSIFFPGALQTLDMRLLYIRNIGDFADSGTTPWFQSSIPLPDCQEALADWICAEYVGAPENATPGGWIERAQAATRAMVNRETAMKQRQSIRRRSRSGRLEGYGGYGW